MNGHLGEWAETMPVPLTPLGESGFAETLIMRQPLHGLLLITARNLSKAIMDIHDVVPRSYLTVSCVQIRRQETVQVANHVLERLGQGQVTAELLQPDELVSGMMAQIAAEPNMASLLTDFIYSAEGGLLPLSPLYR